MSRSEDDCNLTVKTCDGPSGRRDMFVFLLTNQLLLISRSGVKVKRIYVVLDLSSVNGCVEMRKQTD